MEIKFHFCFFLSQGIIKEQNEDAQRRKISFEFLKEK